VNPQVGSPDQTNRRTQGSGIHRESKTSLEELKKTARGDGNLMVPILNCVRAYCTLGEICDALRACSGVRIGGKSLNRNAQGLNRKARVGSRKSKNIKGNL